MQIITIRASLVNVYDKNQLKAQLLLSYATHSYFQHDAGKLLLMLFISSPIIDTELVFKVPPPKPLWCRFSCLKWPWVVQELLWLHFCETKQPEVLKRGAWLLPCAGGSEWEQSSPAWTVSTSTLADTWTEPPASGPRDSERYNSQSLTETKKHTSFYVTGCLSIQGRPRREHLSTTQQHAINIIRRAKMIFRDHPCSTKVFKKWKK